MTGHSEVGPTDLQQDVFELVHDRLGELFGPGGSFRITLGRPTAEDALFVDTVAETIAWQVAAALGATATPRAQHAAEPDSAADASADEHEQLWAHIEREVLLRRRQDDDTAAPARAA
jgi:hypothetical protein